MAGLCTLVTNLISTFEPDPELDSCVGSAAAAASHAAMAAEASATARAAALTAAAAFEVRCVWFQRMQSSAANQIANIPSKRAFSTRICQTVSS